LKPEEYTLLVVDDVEENRDLLSRRLLKKGFQVLVAESGRQALAVIEAQPVDLVLLDIMMPGMTGLEVLEELRQTRSAAELPIIMCTAKTESDDMVQALELGANDYVTKPIDFPVALARVQSQLRQKKSKRAQKAAEQAQAVERMLAGPEARPGGLLAERYRLESRIGSGAFGTVYRAIHLELDSAVAVKVLQTGVSSDADAIARFRREGISACRVRHPNAVTVLDFGVTESGTAYLVMELLEGHSVFEELLRRRSLSPSRAAALLMPACDVLAVAHRAGIVHRDIKPSNIFLQRTPVGEVVKVLDFGIAKIAGEQALKQQLTVEGAILGTPAYMAPERFGNKPFDGRSDVYSLGVTLFQMLEGRLPFASAGDPMAVAMMHLNEAVPRLQEVAPAAREPLQQLIDRAMAKRADSRPSASELSLELRRVVDGLGADATLSPVAGGRAGDQASLRELEIATVNTAESAIFVVGGATLDASQETARDPDSTLRPPAPITEETTQAQPHGRKTGS
jgi:serine/threonine protein kinase/FixJ family two-component response regulator